MSFWLVAVLLTAVWSLFMGWCLQVDAERRGTVYYGKTHVAVRKDDVIASL